MKQKAKTSKARPKVNLSGNQKVPLVDHLYELRRRLTIVALAVITGSMVAYGVQQHIIDLLLLPSHGQHFIYTSPLGGINFLFSVCLDIGIALSVPIIIYQLLRFLQPLMRATTIRFIATISLVSGLVAIVGVVFGYFVGLPAALNFLLHQFTNAQIKPLVTIQSYMAFVSMYLLGSALMFQLPLVLIIINRIKPLKPSGLLKYERHLIVGAFIVAFVMNPTPNVIDQMIVVIPVILMYQVGIGLIWFVNRGRTQATFKPIARTVPMKPKAIFVDTVVSATPQPAPASAPVFTTTPRVGYQRRYVDGFYPMQRPSYSSSRLVQ